MWGAINHIAHPWVLWALAVLPLLAWAAWRPRRATGIVYSSVSLAESAGRSWRVSMRWLPAALRLGALALLIAALARPQETSGQSRSLTDGLAIQMVVDRSGSMNERIVAGEGEGKSKLEVVQGVLAGFVAGDNAGLKGRTADMVGLIAFARYADTLAPLAQSHDQLLEAARQLRPVAVRSEDGTAIGDALALAAARLRRAEEELARAEKQRGGPGDFRLRGKVIVLLTDGANNAGEMSPQEAAELAAKWGIRIYAIGIDAGQAQQRGFFGGLRMMGGVDEEMLTQIATASGGRFWRADDAAALREAYAAIDALERTQIQTLAFTKYTERFAPFALGALLLFGLDVLLASTLLRRTP